MALDYSSTQVANRLLRPASKPHSAREVHAVKFKATVDANLAVSDLIGLAVIPEYCLPIGLDMYLDDLDSATALVWSAGILNTDLDDLVTGSLLITGSTVGQAAGAQSVNTYAGIHEPATWLAQTDAPDISAEKVLTMKVTTAAGTPVAGDIYGVLYYIASEYGL